MTYRCPKGWFVDVEDDSHWATLAQPPARQLERHRVAAGADPVVRWSVLGRNVEGCAKNPAGRLSVGRSCSTSGPSACSRPIRASPLPLTANMTAERMDVGGRSWTPVESLTAIS